MNTLHNAPASQQTFAEFLFGDRRNRIILYLAAATIVIQFAIFKYLYPFANYLHDDSSYYLNAAYENLTIATYPIGYSKFLRLVSVFAKPDLVLVSLQYLMIQCSILFLLFTIFYFYKAGQVVQIILLSFMVLNPLLLYLSNMVSSDGLFLALSLTWFTLLLWIIYKPSDKIIWWHAIVLFAAFTVRYNALVYPLISLAAFWLSPLALRKKITGMGLGLLLIGWFVGISMFQYKKLTGYWQFSPFSGWLWTNNAMYAYREVDSANLEPVPLKFRALDDTIRKFHRMDPNIKLGYNGIAYMWMSRFPLMQYPDSLFKIDKGATPFKKWASMGPFYSSYGLYIIKKYPMHFLRHFIVPNTLLYLSPPVEFLGGYNLGKPTIPELAVKWFGYKDNKAKTRMKSIVVSTLKPYPQFVSITHLIMLLLLLSYILLKGWQQNMAFNKTIYLAFFCWLVNSGFTIFTCAAALRFQAFPILLCFTITLLLTDWMTRFIHSIKLQSQQQQPDTEYSQNISA